MKAMFVSNNFKDGINKIRISSLIQGVLLLIIAISGLFFDSKIILKLVVYIIPVVLIINAFKILKMALYLRKTDSKHFILFIIQSIILLCGAVYIFLNPIGLLNYILVIIGILILLNGINKLITSAKNASNNVPIITIIIGLLCIGFSNQIINTFYTIFLIGVLLFGISKIITFIYLSKLK